MSSFVAYGQTAALSGAWTNNATWSGGIIPPTNVTSTDPNVSVVIDNKNITLASGITVVSGKNYAIEVTNNGVLEITGDVVINGTGTLTITGSLIIHGSLTLGAGSTLAINNNVSVLQVDGDASIGGTFTANGGSMKFGGKLELNHANVSITNGSTTLAVTGDVNMVSSTLSGNDSKWLFLNNFTADVASSVTPPANGGAYMAVAGNLSGNISSYPSPYNLYIGGTNSGTSLDANFPICNSSSPHPHSGCNVGDWTDFLTQNSPLVNAFLPVAPSSISGNVTVCPNKTGVVYSVAPITYATSYEWTMPAGATIIGSATGNSITVDFSSFIGGTISVKGKNAIGVSATPSNLNVAAFTVSAPTISGLASACEASTGNIYTTEAGGSNYTWVVNGGTITSGGASVDNSVTVSWPAVGAQSVSVKYTDVHACESGVTSTYPVTVNKSYTPSVSIVKTSTDLCQGASITFTATPTNGGTTPLYTWFINGSSITTSTSPVFSHVLTANDGVTCEMTSSLCTFPLTNPAKSNKLAGVVKFREINLANVSPTAFCAGSVFNSVITVPCDFPVGNVFTVQLVSSTEPYAVVATLGTVTASAAGTYTIISTIPISVATGSYRVRVSSSYVNVLEGISQPSNIITISSSSGVPIDPNTFGTSAWNVFCYSGNSTTLSANTYMGYYTENNLSFDSRTRWKSGDSPATDKGASGLAYQGCSSMPASNISLSFKRTNIPCGYYQINIPYHDDTYELYIDNVKVASHYGCCDSHVNVWTGWLSPSSKVELRLFQGAGGSGLQVQLVNANSLVVSPDAIICNGTPSTLTANAGAGVTYSWSPTTGLNTSTGSPVIASPTEPTAYTVTATDGTTGCSTSKTINVTVASSFTLVANAVPTTTVCGGVTSTTLTATGANTYTWSSVSAGFLSTSNSITVSPTSTVTYTVVGSIGSCTTDQSKLITITGMNPGGSVSFGENDYGNNVWNASCYALANYTNCYGFYTENKLSFDTNDRVLSAPSTSPSNADATSGLAYSGCALSPTLYSISFKRTNVPCGYYTLNIDHTDDSYAFLVNGVQVASSSYIPTLQSSVWTGFIGPSTKLELRVANTGGPGRLKVTFVPALPNELSTPATICAGTSTTLSTTTKTGQVYSWSAANAADAGWLSGATASTVVVTPPSGTLNGIHNFICTTTDAAGTGCAVDQTLPLEVRAAASTSVTPPSATVNCPSANLKLTALGANTYTWTATPSGSTAGLSATTGAVVTVNPSVTTTYHVSGSNNCNSANADVTVTVISLTDPATFPSGKWNAYVYKSTTTAAPANYTGFYSFADATAGSYGFSTPSQWNTTAGPSAATGYQGCAIGGTYYTVAYKRTNFPCAYYQIDIPTHDDVAQLYIDGVLTTYPWKGYLTPTSQVAIMFTNNAGPGSLAVAITSLSPIESLMPLAPAVCAGGAKAVDLTVTAGGVGNTYSWSPTTALSAPSSATTNANPTVATTYTVSVINCGGTVMGTKSVTVEVLSPSIIGVQPTNKDICENTNTAFSITSSNPMGFVWQISTNNGSNWADLSNVGVYGGATTKDLTLTAVPYSLNGMKYRCMTTVCANTYSNAALLTVKQAPTLVIGTYYTACQGSENFSIPFTTTESPLTYSLSGFSAITDAALGITPLHISIPALTAEGDYPSILKVKNSAGCESLPASLNLKIKKITPLGIYNKPNK
jgi:hypothetical protein